MATIRTSIQVTDGMSPAFRSMNTAMNIILNSFESIQRASHNAIDTNSIQAARTELARAETSFNSVEQQIREANQQQQGFNQSIRNGQGAADGLMGKIKGIAISIGTAFGVKKIIELSDGMASTNARLLLVNDGLQTQAELQDKIYQAAQRSRGAYGETASTVAKLGLLAGNSFKGNDEAIKFAELMSKSFKVSGASASEASNGMYQLTQAMASGRLQGDEFRSIMENAPMLAQAIAKYAGKSMGELREMSKEGEISSAIIKNALFSAADDINAKFETMPMTFGQVATVIGNNLLQTFDPIIQTIGKGGQLIYDNWSTIEPTFWGIAAAVGAYALITGIQTAATWLAVAANQALIMTMLGNPVTWIALGIGVLIGMIYKWVQSVGGIEVAWMIAMNGIMTAWDWVKVGFFTGVYWVMDLWNKMTLGIMTASVAIQNFMGDMKSGVLNILQDMVNGSVGLINDFINILNKIPGVSIDAIANVSFGTTANLENEAAKQSRNVGLTDYRSEIETGMAARDASLAQMKTDARSATAQRQTVINASMAEALAKKSSIDDNVKNNVAYTAANTGSMKDSMAASEESLQYIRDMAEQEVINRFTTAEIKIDMPVTATINNEMDLDGIVTYLGEQLEETMNVCAEGVHK
jgi:tape measure domain-containing protein